MFERLIKKKDPYTPSAEKRYVISEDEFSRRRINFLVDLRKALEEELKIPISFSIYGSLTRGKVLTSENAARADLDMHIDLDGETLPKSKEERAKLKWHLRRLLNDALSAYQEHLGNLKADNDHMEVRILSAKTIHNVIENLNSFPPFLKTNREIALATLFTLSIGEPVKKYRKLFLADLAAMEDRSKAETIWQEIRKVVEKVERKGGPVPENLRKQFPQTLEEALKFYGVKA